jgi:hypothetical protein
VLARFASTRSRVGDWTAAKRQFIDELKRLG